MQIIAGLGNPGDRHAGQRHNIGFMAADAIARRHGFASWKSKFRSAIADGRVGGSRVLLIKPQTYMNLSGEAIGEAMRFYKLAAGDLTVIYDEIDLVAGKVRVKTGGGAGGHNGIKSTIAHCGDEFHRVRLGIGRPAGRAAVNKHVLGDFAKADIGWRDALIDAVADNADLLVSGDHSTFMNRVSLAMQASDAPGAKAAKTKSGTGSGPKPVKPGEPAAGPMAGLLAKLLGRGGD